MHLLVGEMPVKSLQQQLLASLSSANRFSLFTDYYGNTVPQALVFMQCEQSILRGVEVVVGILQVLANVTVASLGKHSSGWREAKVAA